MSSSSHFFPSGIYYTILTSLTQWHQVQTIEIKVGNYKSQTYYARSEFTSSLLVKLYHKYCRIEGYFDDMTNVSWLCTCLLDKLN